MRQLCALPATYSSVLSHLLVQLGAHSSRCVQQARGQPFVQAYCLKALRVIKSGHSIDAMLVRERLIFHAELVCTISQCVQQARGSAARAGVLPEGAARN